MDDIDRLFAAMGAGCARIMDREIVAALKAHGDKPLPERWETGDWLHEKAWELWLKGERADG